MSRREPGSILIEVDGELDMASAPHLDDCLSRACAPADGTDVVLDLSRVTFIDLAGWEVVVHAAETLRRRGKQLQIVALSKNVERLIDLVGIVDGIDIHPSARRPSGGDALGHGC